MREVADAATGDDMPSTRLAGLRVARVPIPVPIAIHSFGGWKRSLFADMAVHCMEGIRFYIRLKTVTTRWPTGIRAGTEYIMRTDALKAPAGAQ